MAEAKLNALALGYTAAILSVACMLFLGIVGNLGLYTGAVAMMQEWHMFFSLSAAGIIAGIIESAVFSFVTAYIFAWLYNQFV